MTVTALKPKLPADADMICKAFTEEMGSLLDMRDYYRDYDVQDHKNTEAIAKAELDAVVFNVKRHVHVKSATENEIDKIVAATTKATIATARRMKREEELSRYERKIADLKKKADVAEVTFPVGWFPEKLD